MSYMGVRMVIVYSHSLTAFFITLFNVEIELYFKNDVTGSDIAVQTTRAW